MKNKRNRSVDAAVLIDRLRALHAQGITRVRAAELSRWSAEVGHYIAKKFIRRRLSVGSDGVTGIEGVQIVEDPKGRFWFALA